MIPSAIVAKNVVKRYRRGGGLNGFSLSVPAGSTMGLVGCNGAGKTTWMMVVAGFVLPDSGSVDILRGGPFDAAVHGGRLSILPQDSELPLDARVRELLVRYARLQGLSAPSARRAADELLNAFNLEAHADKRIRQLSHGMRKRVMVAQAFVVPFPQPDIPRLVQQDIPAVILHNPGFDVGTGSIRSCVHMGNQANGWQTGISGNRAVHIAICIHVGIFDPHSQHLFYQGSAQNALFIRRRAAFTEFIGLGIEGNIAQKTLRYRCHCLFSFLLSFFLAT
jgi:ABC-type transport system involved in cytochrome c biogenesis ATPase subunit